MSLSPCLSRRSRRSLFLALAATVLICLPGFGHSQENNAEPILNPADGAHIALIGNTLFDRMRDFPYFEAMLQQEFADKEITLRNLSWSGDEIQLHPRPDEFGNIHEHLTDAKADIILAAYGFNESFAGTEKVEEFETLLKAFITELRIHHYNGKNPPQIVLISPIAHEDLGAPLPDGKENNYRLEAYTDAMEKIAGEEEGVSFVDAFAPTRELMEATDKKAPLTINGIHLADGGYQAFAKILIESLTGQPAPKPNPGLEDAVKDKAETFFVRYRPMNGYYITGGRAEPYGVVNFPREMEKLDSMLINRDQRIWALAQGKQVPPQIDDSNTPELPVITGDRPINEWMSPADELASFDIDPRFEVNCFASEEDFPELACPIQMRWDAKGRLWVSTSQTYPQVIPGQKPVDKIIILEDTDHDGHADKCSTFAENLDIPLAFEFGDGGLYVSEQPCLTFLKDTDGDGKADLRKKILTGFGTEDSHHSLHDFTWSPDGDLVFRESIFLHTQVETPYGPVRTRDSSYFRYRPATEKLITYGSYFSTNPWGMTYDDWGQQMGSHPIYATAVQALNAKYPAQHAPAGNFIDAYSGTCGHEFVYNPHFPDELQGHFIKNRYKPTNNIEIHEWNEVENHFEEKKLGDLIFSKNLSFIPVDIRFGPRGALYICDWYNPVKGHMQYSLRDTRRDKKSGRIWRVTAKGRPLLDPPKIDGASIPELLDLLKRYEYRTRYWTKRELRERDPAEVLAALDQWVTHLDPQEDRYRHHQLEAVWMYRNLREVRPDLLRELITCDEHMARAAAVEQLRYWYPEMEDHIALLRERANDENGVVRLQAAIAASYIGTLPAAEAALEILKHPMDNYSTYALLSSLNAYTLKPLWEDNQTFLTGHPELTEFLKESEKLAQKKTWNKKKNVARAEDTAFDNQGNVKVVEVGTVPERLLFTVTRIEVTPEQPVKLVFSNPDATQHNLVIVQPGALEEVGMAANEMAKSPEGFTKGFIPESPKILHATKLLNPTEEETLRFIAPKEKGTYPYLCTFPGHWLVMKGELVVK